MKQCVWKYRWPVLQWSSVCVEECRSHLHLCHCGALLKHQLGHAVIGGLARLLATTASHQLLLNPLTFPGWCFMLSYHCHINAASAFHICLHWWRAIDWWCVFELVCKHSRWWEPPQLWVHHPQEQPPLWQAGSGPHWIWHQTLLGVDEEEGHPATWSRDCVSFSPSLPASCAQASRWQVDQWQIDGRWSKHAAPNEGGRHWLLSPRASQLLRCKAMRTGARGQASIPGRPWEPLGVIQPENMAQQHSQNPLKCHPPILYHECLLFCGLNVIMLLCAVCYLRFLYSSFVFQIKTFRNKCFRDWDKDKRKKFNIFTFWVKFTCYV